MCNCDCELTKQERWEIVRRDHAHELAERIRREAAVWGVDTAAGKHFLEAAVLIDPVAGFGKYACPDCGGWYYEGRCYNECISGHVCESSRCWQECHP